MKSETKWLLGAAVIGAGVLWFASSGSSKPPMDPALRAYFEGDDYEKAVSATVAFWLVADLYTQGFTDVYPTARLFAQYEGGSVPPFVLEALSRALGKRVTNATATNDVRAFIRANRPNVRELPYEVPSDLLSNRSSARELLLNTQ